MKTKNKDMVCTFVLPVHIKENNTTYLEYFKKTMNSIFKQTCSDWSMVIVDNASKNRSLNAYLNYVIEKQKQKILYFYNEKNTGTLGHPRNIGIEIADEELGSDIILFQDADDLAHPMRVEATKEIFKTTNADLVYSPFIPIDEHGKKIAYEKLTFSIKDILSNLTNPPVGKDVWKVLAEKMYVNLTSATSVRIEIAKKVPFPVIRCSEDGYTWMLYSAHGAVFHYAKEIPVKYRIPQNVKGGLPLIDYISHEKFYKDLVKVYIDAFFECSQYALKKGTATQEEIEKLVLLLCKKLKEIVKGEEMHDLVDLPETYLKESQNLFLFS